MSNMSYCRFQNTLPDLLDCEDALDSIGFLDELSDEEAKHATKLIKACQRIVESSGWMVES